VHYKKCKDVHKQIDIHANILMLSFVVRSLTLSVHAVTKIRLERFEFNESVKRVTN